MKQIKLHLRSTGHSQFSYRVLIVLQIKGLPKENSTGVSVPGPCARTELESSSHRVVLDYLPATAVMLDK